MIQKDGYNPYVNQNGEGEINIDDIEGDGKSSNNQNSNINYIYNNIINNMVKSETQIIDNMNKDIDN